MMNRPMRAAVAAVLAVSVLTLGGCAKSISVSPEHVVVTAAQPSAQVTVTMKWPHRVYWNIQTSDPDGVLVSPNDSQEKTTQVTVTATDVTAPRDEKITFYIADTDGPEAVLEVHVQ